jgi:hypothetical protein
MNIPFLSKTKPRCRHQTKNGKQCKATPQKSTDYCFFHDPGRQQERTAARRQGGITSTHRGPLSLELASMPLEQSGDVGRFLGQLVIQICLGNVEVRQGTGIAFITTCMMQAFDRARRDAEDAVLGPLKDKRLAALLDPDGSAAAQSFFQSWQMNANDDFKWPSDGTLPEALRSRNHHRDEDARPDEIDNEPFRENLAEPAPEPRETPFAKVNSQHSQKDRKPDCTTGNSKLETRNCSKTLLEKGGTPSDPKPAPAPRANTAGDGCATPATKPAAVTPTRVADGDNAKDNERSATDFDEKAYREEGERLRKQQAEIIARIESKQSEGTESAGFTVSKERESAGQAMAEARKNEEERRLREIEERKELQKYQMERYGCCSPDLDFNPPTRKPYESNDVENAESAIAPPDLAQKKLNAQDLELKKQLAHAIAPATMKSSTFNDEGFVVSKPADRSQKTRESKTAAPPAPAHVRDPDNDPSPIPGLLNRHLNYQKYMGAPVSYLKSLGFVFPRQRWQRW